MVTVAGARRSAHRVGNPGRATVAASPKEHDGPYLEGEELDAEAFLFWRGLMITLPCGAAFWALAVLWWLA
jgi:hypothetical protein